MTNKTDDKRLVQMAFPEVSEIDKFVRHCLGNRTVDHVIILRQRDFSVVGRVFLKSGGSVIYKKVIAPWDCEAEIMQAVQRMNVPNTPLLLGVNRQTGWAEFLQEDVGLTSLREKNSWKLAEYTGQQLAKTQKAIENANMPLPRFIPCLDTGERIAGCFRANSLKLAKLFPDFDQLAIASLWLMGDIIGDILGNSKMGLQHGDVYGENIILKDDINPFFIDWSYFAFVGPNVYDLATLVSGHDKNGSLIHHRQNLITGYAKTAGVSALQTENLIPAAYRLSRVLFLQWLLARVEMGIRQTTVGPVDQLILQVVAEILI